MRVIIVVLIALTFFKCKSSLDINGPWVQTKVTKKDNQQLSMFGRQILDFREDSVLMTSIGSPAIPDLSINKSMRGVYKITNNKLIIRTGSEKMKARINFTTDSLILTIREINNEQITLKRLQERDKNDIRKERFIGKSFLISSGRYTDSIFFMNDSLMLYCGNSEQSSPLKKWKLTDYDGYKFFHTTNPFFPGMIAYKYSDSTITLNPYIKLNGDVKLTQINSHFNNKLLIGTWVENERKIIEKGFYHDTEDSLKLEIEVDKINIIKNERTETLGWRTTPGFSRIYFVTDKNQYVDSWKIVELNDSTLKLRITNKSGMDYLVILTK